MSVNYQVNTFFHKKSIDKTDSEVHIGRKSIIEKQYFQLFVLDLLLYAGLFIAIMVTFYEYHAFYATVCVKVLTFIVLAHVCY